MIIRLQLSLLPPQTLTFPSENPHFQKYHHQPKSLTTSAGAGAASSGPGHRFREKLLYLQTLKVNPHKVLQKNPNLRSTPLETIVSVQRCLASMGIERSALRRIFELFPEILSLDPYLDLYPVFDFLLNDVAIPYPDIRLSILRCPRLLVSSVEHKLRPALLFLRGLGFVGKDAISVQTSVLLICSVEGTLVPKLNFLKGLGFGYDEVKTLVLRYPPLLTYSIEGNYRPKVEYFLKEMNGDLGQLKGFPQYFGYSLEGRIKPRHRMLFKYGFSLSLPEMLKYSDQEFNVRFLDMRVQLAEERRLGLPALLTLGIDYRGRFQAQVGLLEHFLVEMNGDFGQLNRFPQHFVICLEGRIKLQHLPDRGFSLLLLEMLKYSHVEFNVRLIGMWAQSAEEGR